METDYKSYKKRLPSLNITYHCAGGTFVDPSCQCSVKQIQWIDISVPVHFKRLTNKKAKFSRVDLVIDGLPPNEQPSTHPQSHGYWTYADFYSADFYFVECFLFCWYIP